MILRPSITFMDYQKRGAFNEAASWFISDFLIKTLAQQNKVSLFLSGGTTPRTIYKYLSHFALPWERVDIGLVDERWVNEDDSGSNTALIKRTLLQNNGRAARFTLMKSRHKTAKAAQCNLNKNYQPLLKQRSLAVLGMGPDGHTASWFPGADGLEDALNLQSKPAVQAITAIPSKVTGPYLERMTLTLSALLQCDQILLLISGSEKIQVLQHVLDTYDPAYPISHLLQVAGKRITIMALTS